MKRTQLRIENQHSIETKPAKAKLIEAYPILAAHWPNFQEVLCNE